MTIAFPSESAPQRIQAVYTMSRSNARLTANPIITWTVRG